MASGVACVLFTDLVGSTELMSAMGACDEAESWFRQAAVTHERISAPAWRARTRLDWAAMLLQRRDAGDVDEARRLLSQVLASAGELGYPGLERRAGRLLAEVGP
jgi:class 3 adenylate cyclase